MPPTLPEHCRSCAAPLANPDFQGPREHYCKYCVAPDGAVKPRAEARAGIRRWMISRPGGCRRTTPPWNAAWTTIWTRCRIGGG